MKNLLTEENWIRIARMLYWKRTKTLLHTHTHVTLFITKTVFFLVIVLLLFFNWGHTKNLNSFCREKKRSRSGWNGTDKNMYRHKICTQSNGIWIVGSRESFQRLKLRQTWEKIERKKSSIQIILQREQKYMRLTGCVRYLTELM